MPSKSKRSAHLSFRSAAFRARQQPCAVILSRFAPLRIALSPSLVILSGAKNLGISLRVNSAKDLALSLEAPFVILSGAKNLGISLRVNSAKNPSI